MNLIILTGANRGLGREIHDILVQTNISSTRCLFVSRQPVNMPHEECEYVQIDFNMQEGLELSVNIDPLIKNVVFINNAGTIEPIDKANTINASDIERALRINCIAPFIFARQLTVKTSEVGARLFIFNVTSGAAYRPIKGWTAYCVSKSAAVMALDVIDCENEHVKVHHFDPGVMDTGMQDYIRRQTSDVMPDVEIFQGFKNEKALKNPSEIAKKIITMVQEILR